MTVESSNSSTKTSAPLADYKRCLTQKLPALQAHDTMLTYCKRAETALDHKDCQVVQTMAKPGLYLFKRPVHSSRGSSAGGISAETLLKQAGSIMYHIVLYIKTDDELSALEMGPVGAADVHDNLFEAVEAGPVQQHSATAPDGPFLHIDVATHPLSHPAIQQAVAFAQGRKYHTLRGNCIQFADAMVRLLTGGAVFGAPIAYDAKAGRMPPVDSPLLPMLSMTMQLSWLDVCDAAGFMADLLAKHEPPPQLATSLQLHTSSAQPKPSDRSSSTNGADILSILQQGNSSNRSPMDAASLLNALQSSMGMSTIAINPAESNFFKINSQNTFIELPITSSESTAAGNSPQNGDITTANRADLSSAVPAGVPSLPRRSRATQGMKKGFLS